MSDEMQHQIRKSLVLVTVPHKKINVRMTSRKSPQEIDLSVASQGEEVASIKGPFTWVRSQGSLHQKSHLGIRISGPESRSYHVDTEIDISSNKNKVLFTINKAQQLLISYQHDVSGNYESGLSAMSKIEIPEKIKTDFKLEKSSSHVQSDGEVKLEVYSPHHLQYQVSVDRSGSPHQPEGKFSAKIYLDKIRDPEHNVQLSGTYMLEDNSHFSLRGDARIARESYHYALTSSLEGQQSWRNIDKHVKLQIMKESEEFLTLLSSQKFHLEPQHSLELDSELSLVTPSKKEYYLKKQLEVSHEDSATQIKNSFTSHVTDIGEFKSTFSLNSHYQPDLALQLEGELSSSGLNEAQPALQINYKTDLEMSPSSLRRLDAAMNCDISGEKLNVQVSESESDREASLKVLKNDRTILFAHILREEQDGLSAKFDIPPHSFAVSGRYNNQEKSLVIYPNSGEQHGKFTAKFTNQFSEPEQQMNVLLEYPHAGRQKMVVGKFSSGDASTNGHVSFDVFPHSEEAINIKVNATRLGDDMMRYEASVLSSSDVADGPRVVMDVTAADHEKALLVAYRSNLESAPSSLLAAKYIKQSQQSGIVSVLLKTQNKKFEIGGVLKKEHTIGCQGYNLNTTVLSPSDKTYALQIETCSPAFIKVITGAKDAPEEKYVIKAGVKSMTHAELSLTKNMRVPASGWVKKWSGSEFEQKEVPVAAVAAKLVGSQTLALKAQYDQDILAPTKSLMSRELSSAVDAASDFIEDFKNTVNEDFAQQFAGTQNTFEALKRALMNLQDSTVAMEVQQSFFKLPSFMPLINATQQLIRSLEESVQRFWEKTTDILEDIETFMADTEVDNSLFDRLIPHSLLDKAWETLQLPSLERVTNSWTSSYPRAQAAVQTLVGNLAELVRQTASDLREYGKLLLLQDESLHSARDAALRSLKSLRERDFISMLHYWLLAPFNMGLYVGNSTIQLNLPLQQPTGSLMTALITQPPPYPPFPKYSMTLSASLLLTVRKQVIAVPFSSCEYVLSKMNSGKDKAIVTFKDARSADFSVQFKYGKHSHDIVTMNSKGHPTLINSEAQPVNFTRFIGGMRVSGNERAVQIMCPDVECMWDLQSHTVVVKSVERHSTYGVGWTKYPRNPTPDQIIRKFNKEKVDSKCKP
ncbi:uncharacterized protein LOC108679568 isoform X2 [Hyalella azteca]|uniref:Uncharacterized protein LOC108679568 isoform X2 n=1 Tax=Hyalella azteca TaxID=294128 RepID=A0A8B7PC19_HYAAZ|nr:uncharacterized protein LOC108679568 isoform X2 [Hyalella azteca]